MKPVSSTIENDPILAQYRIGAPRDYPDDGTIGIPFGAKTQKR